MDGYYVSLKKHGIFSPGSRLWFLSKKNIWHPLRSIVARFLMILYTIILNYNVAKIFGEYLFYLNYFFIVLILIDGYIVFCFRDGLEDSWCSFSILFFVSANVSSLFMLEINVNSFWLNIFQDNFSNRIEQNYKRVTDSMVLSKVSVNNHTIIDSDRFWFEGLEKVYEFKIGQFESTFCYILILVRFLLPRVGLTWSNIGSMFEYTFNTLFDIYSTCELLRESRFISPTWLTILNYCTINSQLMCMSLTLFAEPLLEEKYKAIKLSPLRYLVENYYFQYIVQIVLAELPFLISRLIMAFKWYDSFTDIKVTLLYSICKQIVIITCKILIMIHHKIKEIMKEKSLNDIIKINNMHSFIDTD